MEIRRARPAELTTLGELTVAAYAQFTTGPADHYVAELRDVARRAREAEVWVAADGDTLLGCVTYCPPGSRWREISAAHEGEFRMLAVAPTARGRGAGQGLVRLCEERATRDGASAMALSSLPSMATAHRLYERLGYRRQPERDWDPVPGVHLIVYRLDLP